jgi:hypothetical protein
MLVDNKKLDMSNVNTRGVFKLHVEHELWYIVPYINVGLKKNYTVAALVNEMYKVKDCELSN